MTVVPRFISFFVVLGICAHALADGPLHTAASDTVAESVLISFRMKVPTPDAMPDDARGLGLVVFDSARTVFNSETMMDEPNHDHAISIGFDIHNPQPTDLKPDEKGRVMGWFDGFGNWYNRPQREVSVHANGRERLNVLSPTEYRTGEWAQVFVQIDWILGGAHIMVRVGSDTIIDQPIWDVRPMTPQAVLGVVGSGIEFADLQILARTELQTPIPEPIRINVFDQVFLANAATLKSVVEFETIAQTTGRVIATLTLSEPEVGYDHWDKKGTVGIAIPTGVDAEGNETTERFEIFRFITPYRRGWTWHMDVTDFLPLFKNQRALDAHIGTYMKGWNVSFMLDFYPGIPESAPIKVVNLWTGNAEIGNPEKPVSAFYVPREVEVPTGTTHARVRMTVTGHGMSPNSKNAGEFMPIWRTLTIGTTDSTGDVLAGNFIVQSERNHLWKTDVYLNPCRPQGGTWKFDRSGWAPGDKVEPWKVDTQQEFIFGDSVTIEYELDEYLNEGRGETWAPHHWTDAVIVFYK